MKWFITNKINQTTVLPDYVSQCNPYSDYIVFSKDFNGELKYGIMDFNGNIIVEPKFSSFDTKTYSLN